MITNEERDLAIADEIIGAVDFPIKDATVEIQIDVYTSSDGGITWLHRLGMQGMRGDHTPFAPPSDPTNPYTFKFGHDGTACRVKVVTQTTRTFQSSTDLKVRRAAGAV